MFSKGESLPDTMISIPLEIDLVEIDSSLANIVRMEVNNSDGFFNDLLRLSTNYQKQLRSTIVDSTKEIEQEGGLKPILWILFISFLYGIAHSLGPGHNKVVVFSYFLTQKPKIRDGILMGNLTAFIHALSGLMVAFVVFFVVKEATSSSFDQSQATRISTLISFGLIALIGFVLLIGHIKSYVNNMSPSKAKVSSQKSIIAMAFTVGIIPCPGTMILVSFLLTFGFIKLSVFAALFMAMGMGFTISLIALASIIIKKQLLFYMKNNQQGLAKLQFSLSVIGSLLIIIFGTFFFMGAW